MIAVVLAGAGHVPRWARRQSSPVLATVTFGAMLVAIAALARLALALERDPSSDRSPATPDRESRSPIDSADPSTPTDGW